MLVHFHQYGGTKTRGARLSWLSDNIGMAAGCHSAIVCVCVGDMLYIKLNFIGDTRFPSIGVIQEHQIFSRSPTITTDDIAEMRGGLNSDSDSDSD